MEPPALDGQMFPHIIDCILQFSSPETLSIFARTSKTIRERIFDRYLPVQHIVVHTELGAFGVDKSNTAVKVGERIATMHRSRVRLVDLIGDLKRTSRTFNHLVASLGSAHLRIVPYDRTDAFMTMQRQEVGDGHYIANWSVTLPFSFSNIRSSPLAEKTIFNLMKAIFALGHATPDCRVAIVMVESPDYVYDPQHFRYYRRLFVGCLALWLATLPFPVQLVFVNFEVWLKFFVPSYSFTELRSFWIFMIKETLNDALLSLGPNLVGVTCIEQASFMTVDQYKNDVGAPSFDLRTRFQGPIFDKI